MARKAYCERLGAYDPGEPPRIGEIDEITGLPDGLSEGDVWRLLGVAKWKVIRIEESPT